MEKDTRLLSRQSWTGKDNTDAINVGSLQRIADSLEKIEEPYRKLIESNEYLRKRNKSLTDTISSLENSNRTLKGWVTRLKKK